jgi:hypothetical protein
MAILEQPVGWFSNQQRRKPRSTRRVTTLLARADEVIE